MDFPSVLSVIKFKPLKQDEVLSHIPFLKKKYAEVGQSAEREDATNWIMGELRPLALGNMSMNALHEAVQDNN
jgi:glutamyl-tRNA(Gln) amidotransferase subunit E